MFQWTWCIHISKGHDLNMMNVAQQCAARALLVEIICYSDTKDIRFDYPSYWYMYIALQPSNLPYTHDTLDMLEAIKIPISLIYQHYRKSILKIFCIGASHVHDVRSRSIMGISLLNLCSYTKYFPCKISKFKSFIASNLPKRTSFAHVFYQVVISGYLVYVRLAYLQKLRTWCIHWNSGTFIILCSCCSDHISIKHVLNKLPDSNFKSTQTSGNNCRSNHHSNITLCRLSYVNSVCHVYGYYIHLWQ